MRPVSAITPAHVADTLRPIWTAKKETANKLRSRIERVLDYARAQGLREGPNPAAWKGALSHLLPPLKRAASIKHYKALAYSELPALAMGLRGRRAIGAKALLFNLLTGVRTGELIGARWDEVEGSTWTIPKERMKVKTQKHRVPLSKQALALLGELPRCADFIFPGRRSGHHISELTMLRALRLITGKQDLTVHERAQRPKRLVPRGDASAG